MTMDCGSLGFPRVVSLVNSGQSLPSTYILTKENSSRSKTTRTTTSRRYPTLRSKLRKISKLLYPLI